MPYDQRTDPEHDRMMKMAAAGIKPDSISNAVESALKSEDAIPALDLTRELYAAVVRSVDDDCSASEALSKLQNRVLLACARFECATVIV